MSGPYLYDEGPEAIHTGTPRRRPWFLVLLIGGPLVAAVAMVVLMVAVRGTPAEQAREVTDVFLAALAQDDVETAYGLLCEAERAGIAPGDVAATYAEEGRGLVTGVTDAEVDGDPVQRVTVAWDDGATTRLTVVAEDGARICGTTG
jgi:hypothetical protein